MAQKPKKRAIRWFVLFGISGLVDLIQIIIDFTGAGVIISEILEAIMPFVLIGLFLLFRIPVITKINRLLSIAATDLGDAVTGGAAPFWVLDVWYIYRDVKKEEAAIAEQEMEAELISQVRKPLNTDGRRLPQNQEEGGASVVRNQNLRPLNMNGVRQPGS